MAESDLVANSSQTAPALLATADSSERASEGFWTFFRDMSRNANTLAANYRNAMRFFRWFDACGPALVATKNYHRSAKLEQLILEHTAPTVKRLPPTVGGFAGPGCFAGPGSGGFAGRKASRGQASRGQAGFLVFLGCFAGATE